MINAKALNVLEFNKIKQDLSEYAISDLAKKICNELVPYNSIERVINEQLETEEASTIINYIGYNPITHFVDIRQSVSLAEKGAVLSPKNLLSIAFSLKSAKQVYNALIHGEDNTPKLSSIASNITLLPNFEENITSSIYGEDEIADSASSKLADIRRKIRQANSKVKDKLNSMIRSSSFQKYLQENIITIRADRYVLPVKVEYRANVPGLVHDQSASGSTLFIEPMAIVEINNDIKQLLGEEKIEINRILQAFSEEVALHGEALRQNIICLEHLDFCFAKAEYGKSMHAIMPKINDRGYINIVSGRHPLLDPEKVVPLNLWIGEDFVSLVITGPNTGGKTVTLKTVGLFTLMMQAGLQIPAELGTEMSVFGNVYADIGDEQSIEQSLSTFSSHMKNIVEILNNVNINDLVLFDELGAGTDPTEGAALAQSILSNLLSKKIITISTTHYSELKAYALSTQGIENASVEFNVETLSPTFRLSIGIPGKSNAFEISKKLGLPDKIINDAKSLLSSNSIKFEDLIANAEYHRKVAEKERLIAEQIRQETVKLRDEADKIKKQTEENKSKAIKKSKDEAKRILENARREAQGIVKELKVMKNTPSNHNANALLKNLDKSIDDLSEKIPTLITGNSSIDNIEIGDRVLILGLNIEADVLEMPDSKGDVLLQAGAMKTKVNISSLNKLKKKEEQIVKSAGFVKGTSSSLPLDVDVRGMALDEALIEVDSYLYSAMMRGYKEVNIIHGKGTGVLKQGISNYLKALKYVKSFRLGRYGEGEDGVTIVTLK